MGRIGKLKSGTSRRYGIARVGDPALVIIIIGCYNRSSSCDTSDRGGCSLSTVKCKSSKGSTGLVVMVRGVLSALDRDTYSANKFGVARKGSFRIKERYNLVSGRGCNGSQEDHRVGGSETHDNALACDDQNGAYR